MNEDAGLKDKKANGPDNAQDCCAGVKYITHFDWWY